MPNRSLWTISAAALLLPLLSAASLAADMQRLFGCNVDFSDSDFIALYAVEQDDYSWTDLQFVYAKNSIISAMVPAQPQPDSNPFYFSNSSGPEGYYAQVRFSQNGRDYLLHMLDLPPDPEDLRARWSGLTITEPNGVSYDLPCGETEEYVAYMSEAMNCDMTNRYGAAGCDFDIRPTRAADDKLPEGYAP